MNIREKVARAIQFPDRGRTASIKANAIATVAITTFLEAAAEKGWHLRPDEATEEMVADITECRSGHPSKLDTHDAGSIYRDMLAAAPEFEVDGK